MIGSIIKAGGRRDADPAPMDALPDIGGIRRICRHRTKRVEIFRLLRLRDHGRDGSRAARIGRTGLVWVGSDASCPGYRCGMLAMLERIPPLNIVPVYFLGMIAFRPRVAIFAVGGSQV